jgi:hypothetical protein
VTKLLQLLSLLWIIAVGLGVFFFPNASIFWLASASPAYQLARIIVGSVLLTQFLSHPPRHIWFRLLSVAVALGTVGWAVAQVNDYHMQLLDVLVFFSASCTMIETALERRYKPRIRLRNVVTARLA